MTKKLLINSGLVAVLALALAACNDSDGTSSSAAPAQFGAAFAQAFGTGVNLTGEPVAVQAGDAGAVSLTAEPVAVQ